MTVRKLIDTLTAGLRDGEITPDTPVLAFDPTAPWVKAERLEDQIDPLKDAETEGAAFDVVAVSPAGHDGCPFARYETAGGQVGDPPTMKAVIIY